MTTEEDWKFRADYMFHAADCLDRRAEELKAEAARYRAAAERARGLGSAEVHRPIEPWNGKCCYWGEELEGGANGGRCSHCGDFTVPHDAALECSEKCEKLLIAAGYERRPGAVEPQKAPTHPDFSEP